MKKRVLLVVVAFIGAAALFAQNAVTLDNAIDDYAKGLVNSIQKESRVAVIAFETEKRELSEYLIDTAIEKLWEKGVRSLFERQKLEVMQRELNYSLSGYVSDETALSIAKRVGVNTVVYGALRKVGNNYRINFKAANVETAQLIFPKSYDLRMDSRLTGLLGISGTASTNERSDVLVYDGSKPDPRVPSIDVSQLDRNTRIAYESWLRPSYDQFRRYRTEPEYMEFMAARAARITAAGKKAPNADELYREFVGWYISATPTSALEAEVRRQAKEKELQEKEAARMDNLLQGRTAEEVWGNTAR
jgi:TolB-like protein